MMKPKQDTKHEADKLVRDIKRATRRKFSAEEKIRIVLAGLRGEDSIAGYCQFNSGLADWRDENQNTQLPSSSLSLRNHQSRPLAVPSFLSELP